MKTNIKAPLKLLAMTAAIGLNTGIVFADETADTYNNSSWQSPLVVEFYGLDTTGNGLLLPNEAAKGKAFNKKTFAQADTDHDGYIDQNEYIFFKTGASPDSNKAGTDNSSMSGSAKAMTTAEGDAMADEAKAPAEKRTVGKVIDDSIITAKAEILKAPELKSLQISVETRNGEVLLSGLVDNAAAKMQAEALVAKIEGVKTVINSLEVKM